MARPRTFDEHAVIAAAREQFRRTGYAATSIDDLVRATGLGKGSLYGAFGDKHALFLRAYDDYRDHAVDTARAELEGPDAGALDRIRAYVARVSCDSALVPGEECGCMLSKATVELAGSDDDVAARSLESFELLEAVLVAAIEQAQAAGELDSGADAGRLGVSLLATLRGIELLGRAGKPAAALDAIAEDALAGLPAVAVADA
ncbi:MAG: ycfQ2 [Thermoleophilia bacterium]|nr:ycfQ2 [Thermoleophilia bacterium]